MNGSFSLDSSFPSREGGGREGGGGGREGGRREEEGGRVGGRKEREEGGGRRKEGEGGRRKGGGRRREVHVYKCDLLCNKTNKTEFYNVQNALMSFDLTLFLQ